VYNHMRQGEMCDANLRKYGYSTSEYDDKGWDFVKIARAPGGRFATTDMPPIRIIKEIAPISVINDNIYDFGINTSGWVKIRVTGNKGQKITIKYDETLNADNTLHGHINKFNVKDNLLLKHEDIFICSGREKEVFAPHFCYHGFRYVKIDNAPSDIEVVMQVVHTDLQIVGDFSCDDEILQKIHNCTVNSIMTNFHGIPTDCPHREQNGWTGDAQLSSEAALMNLDIKEAYRKWLDDFKDVQRSTGQLPGIIPTTNWGYDFGSGPAWDCAIIVIPWNVYLFTGDKSILSNMWDNICLYMEFFESMSQNGISDFGLGDWCTPIWDNRCPNNVTDTAYHYYCLCLMSKIAKVLEKKDSWQERADFVKKAWRTKFLEDTSLYKYQTFFACAIYMELLNKEEEKCFAEKLSKMIIENRNRFDCGILGIKFIFTVLSEHGYIDVLYRAVTNPECPSYAWWINNGATTLCETWNMNSSHNHHMFSEVDNWFYKYIAGIRFTEDGLFINPIRQNFVYNFTAKHRDVTVNFKNNTFTVMGGLGAKFKFESEEILIEDAVFNYKIN
ncbi:MAG: family 78 glycoside hydrolase catalytic domain, partial [Firmicutes bacterium]|nr:family 78 glycoside hydrolase catalytic domain [Bacillota bacterium]